jgi:hypothetical protein
MDEDEMLAVVRAEGLQLAWEIFPEDVRTAFKLATRQRSLLQAELKASDEPWPPMRTGHAA